MTSHAVADRLPKILVADGDVDTHLLYTTALGLTPSEVTCTVNGRDALVKALEHPFALIITEIHLPLVDGYALCEILRRDRATQAIPIMVITADARPASLERALAAGADMAVAKPYAAEALLTEAQQLILRSHRLRDRSDDARGKVSALFEKSQRLIARGAAGRRSESRAHQPYDTTHPPTAPPALRCPSCDGALTYEFSHIGGLSLCEPEQWDYYTCPGVCGRFQYRPRTRKVQPL
jgi:CheY-like chemotaxis protein